MVMRWWRQLSPDSHSIGINHLVGHKIRNDTQYATDHDASQPQFKCNILEGITEKRNLGQPFLGSPREHRFEPCKVAVRLTQQSLANPEAGIVNWDDRRWIRDPNQRQSDQFVPAEQPADRENQAHLKTDCRRERNEHRETNAQCHSVRRIVGVKNIVNYELTRAIPRGTEVFAYFFHRAKQKNKVDR